MIKFLKGLFVKRVHMPMQKPVSNGGSKHTIKVDTSPRTNGRNERVKMYKRQGMLLQTKTPVYITVTVDAKYLGKWGKG